MFDRRSLSRQTNGQALLTWQDSSPLSPSSHREILAALGKHHDTRRSPLDHRGAERDEPQTWQPPASSPSWQRETSGLSSASLGCLVDRDSRYRRAQGSLLRTLTTYSRHASGAC